MSMPYECQETTSTWPGQQGLSQQPADMIDTNGDWDAILSQVQPQLWLTPTDLLWEQWGETSL